MKKILRTLVVIVLCGLPALLGFALALSWYYRGSFPVNTWINGIYCTGMSPQDVNEKLREQICDIELVIRSLDGGESRETVLSGEEIGLDVDYSDALEDYLSRSAGFAWLGRLKTPVDAQIKPSYRYDEEKLRQCFDELDFVQEEKRTTVHSRLTYSAEEGYLFQEGTPVRLDLDKVYDYIGVSLRSGRNYIDLEVGQCYTEFEEDDADKKRRQLAQELEVFRQEFAFCYDMGDVMIEMGPVLQGFLARDQDGYPVLDEEHRFVVDEAAVQGWVEELAEKYDTVGTTLEFQSTRGDIVSVPYVTYGTKLDADAEADYLMDILNGEKEPEARHIPAYLQEGFARGVNDIGGTFIEVDMSEQHLYYYVEGELVFETDVVTGKTAGNRRGTPEGVNFVYAKQRNRTLRGEGYASFVRYWMPVVKNVGLHDADWRKEFGGEIYKKNGSHGCVNLPPAVTKELYDAVEIGTPVVTFY